MMTRDSSWVKRKEGEAVGGRGLEEVRWKDSRRLSDGGACLKLRLE